MREELTRKRLCNIGDTYKTLQLDPKKKKKGMQHLQHLLWALIILSFEKRIMKLFGNVLCLWTVILNNRINLFSNEIKPKELPSKVLIQQQTMTYKI